MLFDIQAVSKKRLKSMADTGVWSPKAPVGEERLRSVFVSYVDFQGALKKDGELVVLDVVAPGALHVFRCLLDRGFPLQSVRPIDEFGACDRSSIQANNTSAFFYRTLENSMVLSTHSYGVAIDVNPYINPYVDPIRNPGGKVEIDDYLLDFLQRANPRPGMVEPVVDLFAAAGFTVWGGVWQTPLDYHHFQLPRNLATILVALDAQRAQVFFDLAKAYENRLKKFLWEAGTPPSGPVAALLSFEGGTTEFAAFAESLLMNLKP